MKNSILIIFLALFGNVSWSQCDGFELNIILNNPTCHGFTDGSIVSSASGGVSPYDYELMDTDGNIIVCPDGIGNSLGADCYLVQVIDAAGCVEIDTVCLIDPDPITMDLSITDPSYPGACDGIVIADTVYGYQGAYESIGYYWTIPGAITGNEVTDVCAGEYTLTVNDELGCSGVIDFALGSLAGIPMKAKQEIKVFPNRSSGELIVQNSHLEGLNIRLLNLSGQVVFDSNVKTNYAIYSPNLNAGVYLYSIESQSGLIKTGKLVF